MKEKGKQNEKEREPGHHAQPEGVMMKKKTV